MQFRPLALSGVYLIEFQPTVDDRGLFARLWCGREFAAHGIDMTVRQCNLSVNRRRHTLRGMHYQAEPHPEAKVVSCLRGAIYDVVIDLRPESATYGQHAAIELNDDNRRALYIPPGLAHGFETLTDDTEVFYLMSAFYEPSAQRGVRWDDPAFAVRWPAPPAIMSDRDRSFADFRGAA